MDASFRLEIDGCDAELRVAQVHVVERLHATYRAEIVVAAVDDGGVRVELDLEALVGQKARLTFEPEASSRVLRGVVDRIEDAGRDHTIVIVPALAVLADRVDYRVFLGKDAVVITKSVLEEAGLMVEERIETTPAKRAQCVQAFEDDLGFVRRLCAEEGILIHLQSGGSGDVVVLSDTTSAYEPLPSDDLLPFGGGDEGGLDAASESVFDLRLEHRVATDAVTLRDFDFERPLLEQTVTAGSGAREHFEYPAGYLVPAVGKRLAERRLEEARANTRVLRARSTCRRLAPGFTFRIDGAPREDLAGPWLLVEVDHRGSDHAGASVGEDPDERPRRFVAEIVAVPADVAFRPQRESRPTIGGVEHATVTGASGSEIHTDQHGRIKAWLRWDRRGKPDDTSSAWMRPMQPPTSGGFFLPRVGWEVLVGYLGPSADQPFELGRLYNGVARPPEDLPAQKVRTNFGSLTSPGGGSANLLQMDDAAGRELMFLNASKDLNERTENDKDVKVTVDDVLTVGSNRTEIVGIQKQLTVTASQTTTVGVSRDWSMTGALKLSAGSESIRVGGLRLVQVGGDYSTETATMDRVIGGAKAEVAVQEVNRHVTGVSTILVGGSWKEIGGLASSQSILGSSTLVAGGPLSIKARDYSLQASVLKETYASKEVTAGGKRVEKYGGSATYTIGGKLELKGSKVTFKATSKIVIEGAGAKITITKSKIVVDGVLDTSAVSIVTGKETND